jgi:chromosome segregation ATPase
MDASDRKHSPSPAELASALEAVGPQLSEWAHALRQVEDLLRASAETQERMSDTRRQYEHILSQIAEARRTLADFHAEKVQVQADWEASQKRWEGEHRELMEGFFAERSRVQREIDALQKRLGQGEQALSTLRATLASIRSRLDSMTD